MNLIKNLTIRAKLLLLFFLILIPMLYFVAESVKTQLTERENLNLSNQKLTESDLITNILHEVQVERALTLAGSLKEYKEKLQVQRRSTNLSFAAYLNAAQNGNTISTTFSQLKIKRNEFDIDSSSAKTDIFYVSLIAQLLKEVRQNMELVQDPQIKSLLNTHYSILIAKKNLALIRTLVNARLISNTFSAKDYVLYATTKAEFDQQLEFFLENAPIEVTTFYQEKIMKDEQVITMFNVLKEISVKETIDFSIVPAQWFKDATSLVDNMKKVEDYAIGYIHNRMDEKVAYKQKVVIVYVIMVLIVVALTLFLSAYIIRIISETLLDMKLAADKVALGNTNVDITFTSKDEIGSLAESLRTLIYKNKMLSLAAAGIGKGDYEAVIISNGKEDELSNSLIDMRDSLSRLSREEKKRNWLLSGNSELNDLLRGEKDMKVIGDKICRHLCNHLHALAGAFYLKSDDRELELTGVFNYEGKRNESFAEGEGIIGQVAIDKKMTLLSDVELENLRINTTFATIRSNEVLLLPLIYNNDTTGVIELLKKNPFEEDAKEYLESISEKIAIILNNVKAEIKTNELLVETQSQAEELETQQEELRQINDELMRQRDSLQASEEELRTSEEELQEKNAELEEKTNEIEEQYAELRTRNDELQAAKEAVQIKMDQVETISKYKSDFLANMSHELRTPLNSILILANILKTNMNSTLTDKEKEHAGVIEKSGNDLLKLINEILDLARIESGKIKLELHEYPVKDFNLEDEFKGSILEKHINFQFNIANDVPAAIQTDKFRLEQILKNLLSNAFKFTPNGGTIEFSVHRPSPKLILNNPILQISDTIAFSVKDSGIGIPDEKKNIIFEAFQQADPSTTRKYGGTGLGLTISRDLATLLGGEIQFVSKVEEGSTFTLLVPVHLTVAPEMQMGIVEPEPEAKPFPIQEKQSETAPTTTFNEKRDDETPSILIIEDDFYFCEIVADYATKKGYEVFTANSGKAGLELAKKKRPNAILLDVKLPDIEGWEVLKKLKNDPFLKKIPVHMMSAYDKDSSKDYGQADFIAKPVTLDILDNALGKIKYHKEKVVKKVIIIEDNENENKAVKELLKTQDMEAESAYTGQEGLRMLKEEQFECIILDINLPDMSGYEVLEILDKDEKLRLIPVIIYSGKELSEEEVASYRKYANTIIIKTAYSYTRLLEEVKLFLYNMDQNFKKLENIFKEVSKSEVVLVNKKVLVADDDMRNIYSLSNILENHGMKVVVAYDGKQAIKELENNPDTNIVLMDIMMPEMDGIDATRAIRKMDKFRSLPIIAVTAKAMPGDKEKCLAAGVSDYISKPIDINKLLSLMRVWLYER